MKQSNRARTSFRCPGGLRRRQSRNHHSSSPAWSPPGDCRGDDWGWPALRDRRLLFGAPLPADWHQHAWQRLFLDYDPVIDRLITAQEPNLHRRKSPRHFHGGLRDHRDRNARRRVGHLPSKAWSGARSKALAQRCSRRPGSCSERRSAGELRKVPARRGIGRGELDPITRLISSVNQAKRTSSPPGCQPSVKGSPLAQPPSRRDGPRFDPRGKSFAQLA